MSGSVVYEKRNAPSAKSFAGHAKALKSTSIAGGEIIAGSSLICSVPYELDDTGIDVNINPGLQAIFPQLSPSASLYSEYVFKRLIFKYVPVVPTSQQGLVGLAFQPNVDELGPRNWSELVSFDGASFCSVWDNGCVTSVPCYDEPKYVRLGAFPDGSDPKTYDIGKLSILTQAYNGSISPGYIQADYEIVLMKRVLPPVKGCVYQSSTQGDADPTNNWAYLFNDNTVGNDLIMEEDPSSDSLFIGLETGFYMLMIEVLYQGGAGAPSAPLCVGTSFDGSVIIEAAGYLQWPNANISCTSGSDTYANLMWGIYNPISATGSYLLNGNGFIQLDFSGATMPGGATGVVLSAMLCRLPSAPANFPDIIPPGFEARPLSKRKRCTVFRHSIRQYDPSTFRILQSIILEARTVHETLSVLRSFGLFVDGRPLIRTPLIDRTGPDVILHDLEKLSFSQKRHIVQQLNQPSTSS